MCGFSKQAVTTVQTLISVSGLFNDGHSQWWPQSECSFAQLYPHPANLHHPCVRPQGASPGCGKTTTTQSGAQIWDPKGQHGQWGALCTLTHYLLLGATC